MAEVEKKVTVKKAASGAETKKAPAKKAAAGKKLQVTLVKSTIGCLKKQKQTVEALGLRKIRSVAVHNDNECIRGMIFVVKHLVKVEEI